MKKSLNLKILFLLIRILLVLICLSPFIFLAARFFVISLSRMGVFYELEFQEGDMALACHRYLKGLPLYPDPEQGFVHMTYPPVMDVVTSFAMVILGSKEIWVGRLVSFLSTMGTCLIIFLWVKRETGSYSGAFFAPLIYLSYYPMSGYWYDIFRPDSVFIFSVMLGSYLLTWKFEGRKGIMYGVAGALVFSVAAYAKQSAVLFGFTAYVIHVILYRNKVPIITAAVGLFSSLLILGYLYLTNPFFHTQCIRILLEHGKNLESWHRRLDNELVQFTLIPFLILLIWHVTSIFEKKPRTLIHLALFATSVYAGLKGLYKMGGYKNNYVPIAAFLSLGMGWFWGYTFQTGVKRGIIRFVSLFIMPVILAIGLWYSSRIPIHPLRMPLIIFSIFAVAWELRIILNPENMIGKYIHTALLGIVIFIWGAFLCHQFSALSPVKENGKWTLKTRYPIEMRVPTPEIVKYSWKVMERIKSLPGTVYMIHHNYYAWLIGKQVYYPVDAVRDLTIGRGSGMVPRNLLKALDERRFDFIVINDRIERDWLDNPIRNAIRNNYIEIENLEKFGWKLLRPVDATGMKPRFVWVRKDWKPPEEKSLEPIKQ
ncbi:hypothetical protein JW926_04955 [Candidatus Sumerlaeota bacterium]|nr:hypothetical protein [Candidatus Sumerlaeota bacterium]